MPDGDGMRAVAFVGSSLSDLKALPDPVQDHFGYALYTAQCGAKHRDAKPLTEFGGSGVLEVVRDYRGGTFRAVLSIRSDWLMRSMCSIYSRRNPSPALRRLNPICS